MIAVGDLHRRTIQNPVRVSRRMECKPCGGFFHGDVAMLTNLPRSILTSSVWMEPNETRIVWITLLSLADESRLVNASISGIAHAARVSIDDCVAAIRWLRAEHEYTEPYLKATRSGWVLQRDAV